MPEMKLVIDGYNLLFHLGLLQGGDLEEARDMLLDMLSDYGKIKKRSILVVFDGGRTMPSGSAARKWVRQTFTAPSESADDRIEKLCEKMRESAFVVTSDAGLISRISPFNSPHVRVEDFIGIMEQARYLSEKGLQEGEDEGRVQKPKKGTARRLPKKKRKQKRDLNKL